MLTTKKVFSTWKPQHLKKKSKKQFSFAPCDKIYIVIFVFLLLLFLQKKISIYEEKRMSLMMIAFFPPLS